MAYRSESEMERFGFLECRYSRCSLALALGTQNNDRGSRDSFRPRTDHKMDGAAADPSTFAGMVFRLTPRRLAEELAKLAPMASACSARVAALLDLSTAKLSQSELDRLAGLIEQAKAKGDWK